MDNDEFEDDTLLNHITSETLLVQSYLTDDNFTGEFFFLWTQPLHLFTYFFWGHVLTHFLVCWFVAHSFSFDGRLVCRSVSLISTSNFLIPLLLSKCLSDLYNSITAPTHPQTTETAVYLTLFWLSDSPTSLSGRLTKWVFEREESQNEIRLSHLEEIFFYCKFHLKPKLLEEIERNNDKKLFFWLAFNLKFQHAIELTEFCNRYLYPMTD